VAAQSKAWFCGLSLAGIVVSNLTEGGGGMSVYCECVLSGRNLLVGLITHPEESHKFAVSSECDREAP
jgi:hypothetical protein